MIFPFEEFGLPVTGSAVTVGSFNGRFSLDDDGLIEWIELDGYAPVGRSWEPGTITVYLGDPLHALLSDPLLTAFADEIAERESDRRPYRDHYEEHRLSKQQYGIRT